MKLLYVVTLSLLLVPSAWSQGPACPPHWLENGNPVGFNQCVPALLANASFPLEMAIRSVQQRYPGKILGARLDEATGVYKIKVVAADGRVQQIWVDSRSGQIVGEGD